MSERAVDRTRYAPVRGVTVNCQSAVMGAVMQSRHIFPEMMP